MKNKYLVWGAVAVGAYLIYKKINKSTDSGRELAPPPVSKPTLSPKPIVAKPPVSPKPKPSVVSSENTISEEL